MVHRACRRAARFAQRPCHSLRATVTYHNINSQPFRLRLSNHRTIDHVHFNMPFETSNLSGAGPVSPDWSFDNWPHWRVSGANMPKPPSETWILESRSDVLIRRKLMTIKSVVSLADSEELLFCPDGMSWVVLWRPEALDCRVLISRETCNGFAALPVYARLASSRSITSRINHLAFNCLASSYLAFTYFSFNQPALPYLPLNNSEVHK